MADPHVTLRSITKSFGAVQVIPPLDLEIRHGEFIVLVGPSGCGKTTTLRMLAGLETVTSGAITIGDVDVTATPPGERDCAMVFQNYALYPHMSVRNNIGYAMKVHGATPDEINERVSEAADLLGLEPYLDRKPKNLSGGQRQRVAIGRALVRHPQVFLFDEPLSNLDAKLRVEMRTEIKLLQKRLGTTAVYVTHDQIEAMTMADRVVVMRAGIIEQAAAPIELYERPANKFVANFIGSPAMNFFDAEIKDGAVLIAGQSLTLPKERFETLGNRSKVIFGIRPEHMRSSDHAVDLTLVPEALEPLGAHTLVLGRLGSDKITAQVDPRFPVEIGRPCTVKVDMNMVHFFDPETEVRL
ncbi:MULTISPECIES: ABC transporter ATP-binding protein [Pacificibacter]|uniref:ABC transporter ATP-binding protein n=1 Tax=Pacificibacter TaxID=1042323 RepID=UPI001C089372|nr:MULTISPECIES: sn-glycerol-3-phosphate ABC transporter ATP-binding protein UgpC [Pacificibacter]MBU2937163.1 sn-glycerol-3-phosphate ABC transporter ATP-binding protein UgpC [Pacificibacter marinus]MDO6617017.1 sn-glycerol-3-phosphate ABC transporter ATP-binding protein UgpC [Pacificibacter sp. 1_MG-2023]